MSNYPPWKNGVSGLGDKFLWSWSLWRWCQRVTQSTATGYVGVTWRWVTLRGQAWAPPYCVQGPGLEEAWQQWLRAHWPGWKLFIQKVPPKNSSCWNQGLPVDGSGFSEFLSVLGVGRRLLQNSKPLEFSVQFTKEVLNRWLIRNFLKAWPNLYPKLVRWIIRSHLIFTCTLRGKYYHSHFTDKKTKTWWS